MAYARAQTGLMNEGAIVIRRSLLRGCGGVVAAGAMAGMSRAQPGSRVFKVGVLGLRTSGPFFNAHFKQTLADLGWLEGRNLALESRRAEDGDVAKFNELAMELVARRPDVLVAATTPYALAAKQATSTIPIVVGIVSEPVATGLVQSLSRPGGNITGVTDFGLEIAAKHLELLRAVAKNQKIIGVLDSDNPVHPLQLRSLQEAGAGIGLSFVSATVKSPSDVAPALASLVQRKARAVIILGGATHAANRTKILELAAQTGLQTLGPTRSWPVAGGLIGYGPDLADTHRQMASLVDKILRGAKPADLPVQQPTKFELVINLKTAKALGITIPQDVLLRADELIQ